MVLTITGLLWFCTSLLYSLSLYLVFCPWLTLVENQREALLNSEPQNKLHRHSFPDAPLMCRRRHNITSSAPRDPGWKTGCQHCLYACFLPRALFLPCVGFFKNLNNLSTSKHSVKNKGLYIITSIYLQTRFFKPMTSKSMGISIVAEDHGNVARVLGA